MDYDKTEIPADYDRARRFQPGVLEMWLERIAAQLPIERIKDIVDLGCGTGRFSAALAERFAANAIGIDPSEKMLTLAREKNERLSVMFRRGSGEAIPLSDGAADLVFLSMVFHHLADPAKTARECHRVLRPHGFVCVRTATAEQRAPYAAFFPGYQELADQILPSAARVVSVFEQAGFVTQLHQLVAHQMAPSWSDLAEKAAMRADSILLRLPHPSFVEGVLAMRAQAPTAPPEFVGMNVDLFIFRRHD